MVTVKALRDISDQDFLQIVAGYTSSEMYHPNKEESNSHISIRLERKPLAEPFVKKWSHSHENIENYRAMLQKGFSFGAYEDEELVGIAIAEPSEWNQTLSIWEFHILESHRRKGIGSQLLEALHQKTRMAKLRLMALETQNTNVPAIDFYSRMGFEIDGIDLSYYLNADAKINEVAVFMKKKLDSWAFGV